MPVREMRASWNPGLSLLRAFHAQGVTPSLAVRSWSGVRSEDCTVVFAMRAAEVQIDGAGCSCLLWGAASARGPEWLDEEGNCERLEHCRLAVRQGSAAGFLVYGKYAPMSPEPELVLHVVQTGEGYWAKWGPVTRVDGWNASSLASGRGLERRLAA